MTSPGRATARRVGALLACGGVLLAGCGGGSGSSSRDFVAKANAICKQVNDKIKALGQPTSVAQIEQIGPAAVAAERAGLHQLSTLVPPSEASADWQKIVAGLTHLSANASAALAAIKTNDSAAVAKLAADDNKVRTQVTALATKRGVKECAQG
jgi:hypothetical protein